MIGKFMHQQNIAFIQREQNEKYILSREKEKKGEKHVRRTWKVYVYGGKINDILFRIIFMLSNESS